MVALVVLRRAASRWLLGGLAFTLFAALGAILLQPAAAPPLPPVFQDVAPGRPFLLASGGVPSAPPHTLPALRQALAAGIPALALPLRFTADGEPVVFPPGDLTSSTDGQGPVEAWALPDLQALDAGYRFRDSRGTRPFRGQGLQIPLLEEVLAAFPGVPLLLDVVAPSPAPQPLARLAEIVKRWAVGATILLAARSPEAAATLRRLCPDTPSVSTPAEAAAFCSLARFGLSGLTHPAYRLLWLAPADVTPGLLGAARRQRLAVLAGPAASPDEVRKLVRLGLDGLILTGPALSRPPW
jgi:glycerophosphoryl diester phosphodiesterase